MTKFTNHPHKVSKVILLACIVSLLITTLLWFFIEIPLLEKLPALLHKTSRISIYGIQKLDDNGIPYLIYPKLGKQYNPLMIANQAIYYAEQSEDEQNNAYFNNCIDWLEKNIVIENDRAYSQYHFPVKAYQLKEPWSSALTQSTVMNAMYKKYIQSKDKKWLLLSRQMLNTLVPGHNKLVVKLGDESWWYEEYPSQAPSYVLNGMLSVLLNLHEYYINTSDSLAIRLFNNGFNALQEKLPSFDAHFQSKYDLRGKIASMSYHQMHIGQLQELDKIRPNPRIKHYLDKWQIYRYIPAPIQLCFNFKPNRFLAFSLCWLFITAVLCILAYFLRLNYSNRK